jgi:hypothetical protein
MLAILMHDFVSTHRFVSKTNLGPGITNPKVRECVHTHMLNNALPHRSVLLIYNIKRRHPYSPTSIRCMGKKRRILVAEIERY